MWGCCRPSALWQVLTLLSVSVLSVRSVQYRCDGTPLLNTPKLTSNAFAIKISGNPLKYSSQSKYAVSIEPTRQLGIQNKFTGFALIVEPSNAVAPGEEPKVGSFHLVDEALTKFSEKCPRMVMQSSSRLKSEIVVHWLPPEAGSGCVTFRATIVELGDHWAMHDGSLSRTICEDQAEDPDEQPETVAACCACDEAKYEVTFEGLWSRHTHPKDFPPNGWLTRFSDVIGASHTGDYRFWRYGKEASDGLKQVAERGYTRALESELKSESESIRTIIKARGISYPNVTGKTFAVFRADKQHHLMSLVSMIMPSPDWIVGVSGLELCLEDCSWVESKILNLNPWDAGTDSGERYTSPDSPTEPREPIRQITSNNPDFANSPFYDPSGERMKPLARLYITRQRIYEKNCDDDSIDHEDDDISADCAVGEWKLQTECSVTCGPGFKYEQRHHINPERAEVANCNVPLTRKEPCHAPRFCSGESSQPFPPIQTPLSNDPRCAVTEWSDWSGCSATCGSRAVKTRSREYRLRKALKICGNANDLQQTMPCEAPPCDGDEDAAEETKDLCEPQWADWTPCSVSCGKGVKSRSSSGHSLRSDGSKCSGHPKTMQVECEAEMKTCDLSAANRTEICYLPKDPGECKETYERWYFDQAEVKCKGFIYKGCRGNSNNFLSREDCEQSCSGILDGLNAIYSLGAFGVIGRAFETDEGAKENDIVLSTTDSGSENEYLSETRPDPLQSEDEATEHPPGPFRGMTSSSLLNGTYYNYNVHEGTDQVSSRDGAVDCKVSRWTRWSRCSVSCGQGLRAKQRKIKVHPSAGGRPCPALRREKICSKPECDMAAIEEVEEPDPASGESIEVNASWGPAEPPGTRGDPNNCTLGPWSPWSECSASCGARATQMRMREVLHPRHGPVCQSLSYETRPCSLLPCM